MESQNVYHVDLVCTRIVTETSTWTAYLVPDSFSFAALKLRLAVVVCCVQSPVKMLRGHML
jgi:hypothetical protein